MPELPWWFFPISRSVAAAGIRGMVRAAGSVGGLPPPVVGATHRALRFIDPRPRGSHVFLSDEWIAAAREIREEYTGRASVKLAPMRVNFIVTDGPSGVAVFAHTDTTSGEVEFELEHVPDADLVVTLPFAAARAILVDADAGAAMQQFTTGRIKVEGDVTKLLALAAAPIDALALEVAERIRAMTA